MTTESPSTPAEAQDQVDALQRSVDDLETQIARLTQKTNPRLATTGGATDPVEQLGQLVAQLRSLGAVLTSSLGKVPSLSGLLQSAPTIIGELSPALHGRAQQWGAAPAVPQQLLAAVQANVAQAHAAAGSVEKMLAADLLAVEHLAASAGMLSHLPTGDGAALRAALVPALREMEHATRPHTGPSLLVGVLELVEAFIDLMPLETMNLLAGCIEVAHLRDVAAAVTAATGRLPAGTADDAAEAKKKKQAVDAVNALSVWSTIMNFLQRGFPIAIGVSTSFSATLTESISGFVGAGPGATGELAVVQKAGLGLGASVVNLTNLVCGGIKCVLDSVALAVSQGLLAAAEVRSE